MRWTLLLNLGLLAFAAEAANLGPSLRTPAGLNSDQIPALQLSLTLGQALFQWGEETLTERKDEIGKLPRSYGGLLALVDAAGFTPAQIADFFGAGPIPLHALESLWGDRAPGLFLVSGSQAATLYGRLRAAERGRATVGMVGDFKPNSSGNIVGLAKGRWERLKENVFYSVAVDPDIATRAELQDLFRAARWKLERAPSAVEVVKPRWRSNIDCRRLIVRNSRR